MRVGIIGCDRSQRVKFVTRILKISCEEAAVNVATLSASLCGVVFALNTVGEIG